MQDHSPDDSVSKAIPLGRLAWGHPVRHLELHAWYWLEDVLERHPLQHEAVARLMERLDAATASLAEADAAAVGWQLTPRPSFDLTDRLERIVQVMRELEQLYRTPVPATE